MEEKIGKVILDTTCYPGKDLYSDGAIEDEMLAISRDFAPEEFNRVISERKSWPDSHSRGSKGRRTNFRAAGTGSRI